MGVVVHTYNLQTMRWRQASLGYRRNMKTQVRKKPLRDRPAIAIVTVATDYQCSMACSIYCRSRY